MHDFDVPTGRTRTRATRIAATAAAVLWVAALWYPLPVNLFKGGQLIYPIPLWSAYLGITMWNWPYAFWWSTLSVMCHWLIAVSAFFMIRRMAVAYYSTKAPGETD